MGNSPCQVFAIALPFGENSFPRRRSRLQPPASGELPLGLGGKLFAHPARVGRDVLVGDMHHRMPLPAVEGAAGALGVAPVRSRHISPPVVVVAQVDAVGRLSEHHGTGHEHFRPRPRIVGRIGRSLCHRDVSSCLHEAPELGVGDSVLVHPEAVYSDAVNGALLRVEVVRAHKEGAAGTQTMFLCSARP